MRLREIAHHLACRLDGDGDVEVYRVTGIDQAGPGDLTFFANPRYTSSLHQTRAAAVILRENDPQAPCAMLRTDHPYLAFAEALQMFVAPALPAPGIDPLSAIAPDAEIGPDVSIGPFVVVGARARIGAGTVIYPNVTIGAGVTIGERCVLHAHVSIRERVVVGARVIVQDGAVLGSDGYGFVRREDGSYMKIPQTAAVVIEDDVEIGANTTIDRPAVGETRVRQGAKIDNLVQVAHGVVIGRHALLAAQVGIAGSTTIGDSVVLAGQVGVAGHLTIGDGTVASAQTGIPNSVPPKSFVSGYPAIDNRDWLKSSAVFRRLPALKKQVAELEQRLAQLEATLAACKDPGDR
ncbi:MAG TPA: UDP-3-O-(3-hydroxymyristoyl)glucosamine N-acyltransferase [Vicinamibacterales bacterium]|nr:UDP-3-O-(3-hydroxymyristoyl)glucosamine N-acyltransferase [Vicinamibacterales bacterium]